MPGKAEATIERYATVRLQVKSRPECITLVRSMLGGLGEFLELDAELLDDLKTAVSEACNNVVLHAYSDGPGPLHLGLHITPHSFDVSVRDQGAGIQRVSASDSRMGVGLAVISALANRAEFESAPGEGTEVRMSFDTHSLHMPTVLVERAEDPPVPAQLAGDIVASLAPAELLQEVMGRLVRAVAAGAHFAVDRFPALHTLTGAISARAVEGGGTDEVGFAIAGSPKRLELRVGPLPARPGEDLFGGSVPASLEPLLEELSSSPMGDGEELLAVVVEPRR